ncbi:MAG: ribosomal-processing cysteine protease Prp [Spirochaetaceae bacterium]|nr:ribosomal-processing cysteine protease Prp [Spirochaetaceae bacterium]
MIKICVDACGLVRSCRVVGHAGAGAPGGDIVCAAVSVLVRTFVRVVSQQAGITAQFSAPTRGEFEFSADYTGEGEIFLRCAGQFLLEGFKSLAEEYPQCCVLKIISRKD